MATAAGSVTSAPRVIAPPTVVGDRARHRPSGIGVAVDDGDGRPLGGHALRDGGADPSARTGDEGDASVQAAH